MQQHRSWKSGDQPTNKLISRFFLQPSPPKPKFESYRYYGYVSPSLLYSECIAGLTSTLKGQGHNRQKKIVHPYEDSVCLDL